MAHTPQPVGDGRDTCLTAGRADDGRVLWTLAVALAVADTLLTVLGLEIGLSEANPVARHALSLFGVSGLFLLKGVSIAALALVVRTLSYRFERAALVGFTLPQAAAVGVNATLIVAKAGPTPL